MSPQDVSPGTAQLSSGTPRIGPAVSCRCAGGDTHMLGTGLAPRREGHREVQGSVGRHHPPPLEHTIEPVSCDTALALPDGLRWQEGSAWGQPRARPGPCPRSKAGAANGQKGHSVPTQRDTQDAYP